MNESRYARFGSSEEDKDFYDKYSPTGGSEWSRATDNLFEDDVVLSERHYQLGSLDYGRESKFSRDLSATDHSGKGPKNYKRSDQLIHDDASDALYRCAEVDASDITVTVKDGVVKLEGTVESRIYKKVAEMVVERIPGVVDIDNHLTIENPRRGGLVHDYSPVP